MISLTAVIRCKAGAVETVLAALVAVGEHVRASEPGTLGYTVIRSSDDPGLLLTQELFVDRASMDAHNAGEGSKAFFAAADGLLDDVAMHIGETVLCVAPPRRD